jgi:hypothetical protein
MSDDRFFDDPLHKKTPRPSAAELANLAAAVDPEGCRGNPKAALRMAARLWLRATQVCEALDAALGEDDSGTAAWYIAGENKQPKETWRAREGKAATGELLKLGTDNGNSEVLRWIRRPETPKRDHLTRDGFIEAFREFRPQFIPTLEREISIFELKQFLIWRTKRRSEQQKAGRQKKSEKSSAQIVPTEPKKLPDPSRQKPRSRRQKGKK